MAQRFAEGRWVDGITGVPVLASALVSFECEITRAFDEGTHRVLFGRVLDIQSSENDSALLYRSRRYILNDGEVASA
ncbi:flavin reductase [Ciceribacter sp. L1K23]|nr:flavin reductase [Ciceribacter sp. L1K22]MBR0554357.1 flavin reductase [Ciceribacter sp. L1K23]